MRNLERREAFAAGRRDEQLAVRCRSQTRDFVTVGTDSLCLDHDHVKPIARPTSDKVSIGAQGSHDHSRGRGNHAMSAAGITRLWALRDLAVLDSRKTKLRSGGDRHHVAREGDAVDGFTRLDRIVDGWNRTKVLIREQNPPIRRPKAEAFRPQSRLPRPRDVEVWKSDELGGELCPGVAEK